MPKPSPMVIRIGTLTDYGHGRYSLAMMATKIICKRCNAPLYLEVDGETCFGCDRDYTVASIERFLRAQRLTR